MVLNPATLEDPAQADKAADVDLAMVPTVNIRPGDVVRVLPGERMPVDGDIIEGKCSVDESMLTGESVPVPKTKGQQVDPCLLNCQVCLMYVLACFGCSIHGLGCRFCFACLSAGCIALQLSQPSDCTTRAE